MRLLALLLILHIPATCFAQKWVSPNYSSDHLDYRDLGYPGVSEIPADDSRISALTTASNGYVYGATSGKQSYLFVYDRFINKVRPLGQLPETQGVHHTLVEGKDGELYVGTGLNLLDEIPLTKDFPGGHRQIETQLWKDVKAHHNNYAGGKLLRINTEKVTDEVFLPGDSTPVEDLGVVEPNNSIYAMVYEPVFNRIYGITYPDTKFFFYDCSTKRSTASEPLLSRVVYSGPERSWRSVPRALLCLENGDILTSGDDGLLVRFDARIHKWNKTTIRIPGEYWESWNYYGYPVVEQLFHNAKGRIWGTTNDGFLFECNLNNNTIQNLGKPRVSRRVRAASLSKEGILYMVCGEKDEPGKLFSYSSMIAMDLKTGVTSLWTAVPTMPSEPINSMR